MRILQSFLFVGISVFFFSCSADLSKVKEGDIIFQTSQSQQSKAIQLVTHSTWSHCGLVLADSSGKLFVLEAIQPVTKTPLKDWVKKGEEKHFVVMRIKNADNILTKGILTKMKRIANGFVGKDYDDKFSWNDEKMYCSELVYKIYFFTTGIQLASTKPLKDFDLTSSEIKQKLQERYKGKIPMNEPVISPQQLLESTWLMKVLED